MKTYVRIIVVSLFFLLRATPGARCDESTPPPPPGQHGAGGNQGSAGAPIDGGLGILVCLGLGYGAKKYLKAKQSPELGEVEKEKE